MNLQAKVTRVSDSAAFTFVHIKTDDGIDIELMFNRDDERAVEFTHRQPVTIEIKPWFCGGVKVKSASLWERLIKRINSTSEAKANGRENLERS